VSKESFAFDDDWLRFDYRYVIDCFYCEGAWYVTLNMVILPDSLHDERINDICKFCDTREDDITFSDILDTGSCSILFGCEKIEATENDTIEDSVICKVASVVKAMDNLRGCFISKAINTFNETGWDVIKYAVLNIQMPSRIRRNLL
jgi:hypothetical protein